MLGFAFATVVVGLIAAAVTHYLYGGLRLQPFLGERATPAARVHLSVLLGAFVLLKAIAYWLDRYGLAVSEHRINKTGFTGLTYTDVNAVLQGRTILAIISLICAALFFANIVRRTWLLPGIGVGLLLLSALLIGGIYPALVQRFTVAPSQAEKEQPYIKRNIEATRDAYGIGEDRTSRSTSRTTRQLVPDEASCSQDVGTLSRHPAARPAAAEPDVQEPAADQGLLRLPDVARRRPLHHRRRDARRRDGGARGRPGRPARRSSGTGSTTTRSTPTASASSPRSGNETDGGRPSFVSSDIPPVGQIWVKFEPRIYFGQESPTYSIVGAPEGCDAAGARLPRRHGAARASATPRTTARAASRSARRGTSCCSR